VDRDPPTCSTPRRSSAQSPANFRPWVRAPARGLIRHNRPRRRRSGAWARPRIARGPLGRRRVVPGKGSGAVGQLFARVRDVPAGCHDRAAPGIAPHRRGWCRRLRQASPLRARRAGTGQIAARACGRGVGRPREGVSEHFQVGERLSGRSALIRGDVMTAARSGRRGRNAFDHQEHAECPGGPVLRSLAERRDHLGSSGSGVDDLGTCHKLPGGGPNFKDCAKSFGLDKCNEAGVFANVSWFSPGSPSESVRQLNRCIPARSTGRG
jgi:hypothetical protein